MWEITEFHKNTARRVSWTMGLDKLDLIVVSSYVASCILIMMP